MTYFMPNRIAFAAMGRRLVNRNNCVFPNTNNVCGAGVKFFISHFDVQMLCDSNNVKLIDACHIEIIEEFGDLLSGRTGSHVVSSKVPTSVSLARPNIAGKNAAVVCISGQKRLEY